jgi:hypothetical protein
MTGPEHYRGAERLLKETEERRNALLDRTSWRVGQAQVHATLALAAAAAAAARTLSAGSGSTDTVSRAAVG